MKLVFLKGSVGTKEWNSGTCVQQQFFICIYIFFILESNICLIRGIIYYRKSFDTITRKKKSGNERKVSYKNG